MLPLPTVLDRARIRTLQRRNRLVDVMISSHYVGMVSPVVQAFLKERSEAIVAEQWCHERLDTRAQSSRVAPRMQALV